MRVYIAGPISGLPDVPLETKKSRFYMAEEYFAEHGHEVVVPMDVPVDSCPGGCNPQGHVGQDGVATHSWECFMKHDMHALLDCDAIAILPGWQQSRGSLLEARVASELGLRQIFLDENGLPVAPALLTK